MIINAKKRGAVDFVVKPISAATLLEKIRSVLEISPKKISRLGLFRKLQILDSYCAKGKSSDVEEVIDNLEQVYYDKKIDDEITLIKKYARDMEYKLMGEKTKQLLLSLSV